MKIFKKNKWPKNGDEYFWIRSDIGDICKSQWADDVPYHKFRLQIGNVFRTRDDAKRALAEYIKQIKRR